MADTLPPDPEGEQQAALMREFLTLGFTQTEAAALAYCWADPKLIAWWLAQGCSHKRAVDIAT